MPKFGKRSLEKLEGVDPELVRLLKAAIIDTPIDFAIDYGVRTAQRQHTLWQYGREIVNPDTGPIKGNKFGMIVTNKDGYKKLSEHQKKPATGYGEAVDVYPWIDGKMVMNDDKSSRIVGKHIKKKALELGIDINWGGDWKNPYDPGHVELR